MTSFATVAVNGSCLSYSYDRGIGAAGGAAAATELRAIRLNTTTGTLQMDASSAAASCASTGSWIDLTDPDVVNITAFTPTVTEVPFCTVVDQRPADPLNPTGAQVYDRVEGAIREIGLSLTGALRSDPRWQLHFTPTSASWLNMVEGWFALLTRRRLQRGVFTSTDHLFFNICLGFSDYFFDAARMNTAVFHK